MSILFDDTSSKRKTNKGKKSLLTANSGLSFKGAKNANSIFDNSTLFDNISEKPNASFKTTKQNEPKQPQSSTIERYIQDHPNIKEYFLIQEINDKSLSSNQIKDRIMKSSTNQIALLNDVKQRIDAKLRNLKKENHIIQNNMKEIVLPECCSITDMCSVYSASCIKILQNKLMKKHLNESLNLIHDLIVLLQITISQPNGKEILVYIQEIEQRNDLESFKENDKRYLCLSEAKKKPIKVNREQIELSKVTRLCQSIISNDFFIDYGTAESFFFNILEKCNLSTIQKRLQIIERNPNSIGNAILTTTNEFIKNNNLPLDALSIYFILFTRYYFCHIYENTLINVILSSDVKLFASKVDFLRKQSAIGFGLSQNFLPAKLKSVPLYTFPNDNPYSKAIGFFSMLPYYYCPIDFCKQFHETLKEIQNAASEISFKKSMEKGKVIAKSDHLLCLDDLFDISLLVFLLSNAIPIYPLVKSFQPYYKGLEMTSDLEFAFTNIEAIISHIELMDLNSFLQTAKERINESLEIDPLNIMQK